MAAARSGEWVYVLAQTAGGVYGWAPARAFTPEWADAAIAVRAVDGDTEGTVPARHLLMLPELLPIGAVDEHTLRIELRGPDPMLSHRVASAQWRPTPRRHAAGGAPGWSRVGLEVTSGPFRIAERAPERLELERSKTFWGREDVALDRVTITFDELQTEVLERFQAGACDATGTNAMPADYLLDHRDEPELHTEPYLGIYLFLVNVERFPDAGFRRALALALPRDAIVDALGAGQQPTGAFVPWEESPEACRDVARGLPVRNDLCYRPPVGLASDPEAARKELAAARERLGDAMPTELTLTYNTGVEGHRIIAEKVADAWGEVLGLEVTIEAQSWKRLLGAVRHQDFDVSRMGWIGNSPDPLSEFLSVLVCDNPNNYPGWCDERFEALYRRATEETELAERMRIAREAEALVLEEAPLLPVYVYSQHRLQRPAVQGLDMNIVDAISLRHVRLVE